MTNFDNVPTHKIDYYKERILPVPQLSPTLLTYKKAPLLAERMKNRVNMTTSPLILQSLEPMEGPRTTPENLCQQFESLNYVEHPAYNPECKSVLIIDEDERLLAKSEANFMEMLKIEASTKVKVVSIFGNTGEGKSHTLNHIFFDGEEIFRTSPAQNSCTLGVWAFYNPKLQVICLDTEGLLGISKKEHQRTRLLLKILAVSDVIIYRTRAERLHRDMYSFLGGASQAYKEHFNFALKQILEKNGIEKRTSALGPSVIVFHETRYSNTLNDCPNVVESAEDIIRSYFSELKLSYDGFSSIKYIGHQTRSGPTCFKDIKLAIQKELESTEVRSPRDPKYIYLTLKGLNEKFKTQINETTPQLYLPAFFTCQDKCLSCGAGCTLSMGHKDEGEAHYCKKNCQLQHQYNNFVYLCKKCYNNGVRQIVEPSDLTKSDIWSSLSAAWTGYTINCPRCGNIYQSRKHWYGNKDPKEDDAVLVDVVHVWPGERSLFGSPNSAQKVLDGVTSISNVVASVGSHPTKLVTSWLTDQMAPNYWDKNTEITECYNCQTPFSGIASIHHCRDCGHGFCEACSSKSQPVPHRGWLEDVRVCDNCYREEPPSMNHVSDSNEVRYRRIGETVINSLSVVKSSVWDLPKNYIKESARPIYWTPDNECISCAVCKETFGPKLALHHCRDCGKGVCDKCSNARKPVPLRGWATPVRVCDDCLK